MHLTVNEKYFVSDTIDPETGAPQDPFGYMEGSIVRKPLSEVLDAVVELGIHSMTFALGLSDDRHKYVRWPEQPRYRWHPQGIRLTQHHNRFDQWRVQHDSSRYKKYAPMDCEGCVSWHLFVMGLAHRLSIYGPVHGTPIRCGAIIPIIIRPRHLTTWSRPRVKPYRSPRSTANHPCH